MSFRKNNSFSKNEKKTGNVENTLKPFELLVKLFTKNSNVGHNRNESYSFSVKSSTNSKSKRSKELEFLCNLEFVLIYTSSLIRQKIDDLNRNNLVQQFFHCAQYIESHLKESQNFVDNLNSNSITVQNIAEALQHVQGTHSGFSNWIENIVQSGEAFHLDIGQDLFFDLEIKAQIFINKLDSYIEGVGKLKKRSSIDNSSLTWNDSKSVNSDCSKRSCFNDEDRKLIDKIKKLNQNIDLPPPKPALPESDQEKLNNYLDQIEQIVKSEKEFEYDYPYPYKTNELKSLKIENNCIMASSMISNDIPSVDMDGLDDVTPNTDVVDSSNSNSSAINTEIPPPQKILSNDKSRDCPLPPVPVDKKYNLRFKLPQTTSNFLSEEINYRKKCLLKSDQSQVTNGAIINFNHRSPLRSPSLVSSINFKSTRSPLSNLSTGSEDQNRESFNSVQTPDSTGMSDRNSVHSVNPSHQLLMAKQIPTIVDDPNDLLNINDMQDDIEIITRKFNLSDIQGNNSNRLTDLINGKDDLSIIPEVENSSSLSIAANDNGTFCDSEVKSDTEEYFEYFEIDGKKYRRKMKKRTVIEKVKIRKTILAPMKQDGTGPDLFYFNNTKLLKECMDHQENNFLKDNVKYIENSQQKFRRGLEDRFRVSKSMFYPYKDQVKRITLCNIPSMKIDGNSKQLPIMNKYMYRFGESDFEEPVIDKRFSTQLTDSVCSTWYKTSESMLPHEKSKSICYLKESRQKNEEGTTVHNAVRVTASRTIRMKVLDNANEQLSVQLPNPILAISNNKEEEESILDGDDSDTSLCITDTSLYEDKDDDEDDEISFKSDSASIGNDARKSNRSTFEDPDLHDLNLKESLENISVPSQRSSDSCFYSHGSTLSEIKDQYTFILKENNPTQYLIFDEDPKYGECDIAGGPVDALIVYACDGKEHLFFLDAFLDTYRTFIEPEELIYRLIFRYKYFISKILSNNDTNNELNTLDQGENDPEKKTKHVLSLLLTVIGKLKRDLTDNINEQIESFKMFLSEINETQWVKAIARAMKTEKQCIEKEEEIVRRVQLLSQFTFNQSEFKSMSKEFGSPTKSLIGLSSNKWTIFNFSSREIAEQMTLLDWCKYRDVELMEILNLKDIINCNLPGVIEYAKHFENVQYWTQSMLLDSDRIADRDKGCVKFLRIMKHLQRLNNFSSFIAILLAIQLLPTKKMFSKRIRSKIQEYDNYMKPPRFSGYKADLKQAVSPCIPFLGIFYQDIVMLNIANPPFLDMQEVIKNIDRSNFSCNNNQLLLSSSVNCGPIINFWRSFKQYLFLKNCNKDQDKIRYSIKENEKILQFLNNFKDSFDESTIQRMIKQLV